jgi:hypothetical protein
MANREFARSVAIAALTALWPATSGAADDS